MRQRLGIARALVNEPQVVFLDEPTFGLDPSGQRQILSTVRRIARERGATVLLSTHLLAEVEETCSRVLILNHGRVAAEGTVADVVRSAAAPRSARLQVAPEHLQPAVHALEQSGLGPVEQLDGQPGTLAVTLELEGARLSDAFLTMTEAA
jgi:ABC-2 type transport system ATP-binding protein